MKKPQQSDKKISYSAFKAHSVNHSAIDLLQTQNSTCFSEPVDDFDRESVSLEEDCLLKLIQQRKKIEQLTFLYQSTSLKLKAQQQKVKKLQTQQLNFEELKTIQIKYLSLSKEFEVVTGEKVSVQKENQDLRLSLNDLSKEHQKLMKLSQLREIRKQEENFTEINRYEELIKDKDDEIRRNLNVYEIKEKQFQDDISDLNQIINQLKTEISDLKRNHQNDLNDLTSTLLKRDALIQKMKENLLNIKQQNSILRKELKSLEDQFLSKQQEWLQTQSSLIFEINNTKRKLNDTESRFNDSRSECQKLNEKLSAQKQNVTSLKQTLKSLEQQSKIDLDRVTHSYEQKIITLKRQVEELKESVEELLEVKDIYNKENQVLKEKISKDLEQKRRRNLMMISELREIQKIENSIRRVF